MQDIKTLLSENYDFNIVNVSPAPRGFIGETYYIDTKNERYFLKIYKNDRYFVNVLQSLPVLKELFDLGINYINYPILTKEGKTYFENAGRYYVLLNYIEGQNTWEYNIKHAYERLIEIHKATERIQNEIIKESFKISYIENFEKGIDKYKDLSILKPYLEDIHNYWGEISRIV